MLPLRLTPFSPAFAIAILFSIVFAFDVCLLIFSTPFLSDCRHFRHPMLMLIIARMRFRHCRFSFRYV